MGLIAREIETIGIPTLSMSSARSITAAVNPPRAVYLDFPLGRTSGKPGNPENQMAVMRDTLAAFTRILSPGTIIDLPYEWRESDSWKDHVMRPQPAPSGNNGEDEPDNITSHADDRTERFDTPQYQNREDALAADTRCPTCVFLETPASP